MENCTARSFYSSLFMSKLSNHNIKRVSYAPTCTLSKRIRFDKSCKKVSDMSHLTALFINYRTKIGRKNSEMCYQLDKPDSNKH